MLNWLRGGSERQRMAQEAADPSEEYVERAREEIENARAMTQEEVDEAADRVERDFLRKLARVLARLNRDVAMRLVTAYYAMRDPDVPLAAKAGFAAVLLYFVNPFDLIPDVTPVIGYLDDAGVLAGAWMYLSGFVTDEHRARAEAYLADA